MRKRCCCPAPFSMGNEKHRKRYSASIVPIVVCGAAYGILSPSWQYDTTWKNHSPTKLGFRSLEWWKDEQPARKTTTTAHQLWQTSYRLTMIDTFHVPTELPIVRCNTLFSRSSFAPLSNENVTEIVENHGKKKQHSSSLRNNHACPLLAETRTRWCPEK